MVGWPIYSIVDDEPAATREWLPVLAEALGAKPPRFVPAWAVRMLMGEDAVMGATQSRGASNGKAKRDLGWNLRYPSWRTGFAAVHSAATSPRPEGSGRDDIEVWEGLTEHLFHNLNHSEKLVGSKGGAGIVHLIRTPMLAAAAAVALAAATAGCGGGNSPTAGGTGGGSQTITYWASDQGSSIADDYTVLDPVMKKFKQETGIKVNVDVIGWPDLLNRILAATTSGQGPDVVNIGNTWSRSDRTRRWETFARRRGCPATSPRLGGPAAP